MLDLPSEIVDVLRAGCVVPAHPLVLDQGLGLDVRRQRALTRYYIDAGVGGIAVGVHTTQFAIREHGLYAPALHTAAYTPELYPTRVRALGVGTATAWLRIASMVGPLVIGALIGRGLVAIFVVFGVVSLVTAGFVAAFAVETKGAVLERLSP